MAQPAFQLLLDDANNGGTFPYDITAYVRLVDGIEVQRGRGNEFDEIQAGTLKCTLENLDGRFTLGSTVGGYGGALNADRSLQYRITQTANPTFDSSTAGWAATANCTVAWDPANGHTTPGSMKLTATAAGTMTATTTAMVPVMGGKVYAPIAWAKAAATSQSFQVLINWYTSGGAFISTSAPHSRTELGTAWTRSQTDGGTAPGNAAQATLTFSINASAAGEVHYVDEIGLWLYRFTGFVQNWPTDWPDGSDQYALARISAVDQYARLSRKTLRSVIEEEYLLGLPEQYYTMGEATGAVSAGNSSGLNYPVLSMAGSGAPVTFGSATGPGTDSLTAASFAGGMYLRDPVSRAMGLNTIAGFFALTGTSMDLISIGNGGVGVDSTGHVYLWLQGTGVTLTGPVINDGNVHHIGVGVNSPGAGLTVDGVSVGSGSVDTSGNLLIGTSLGKSPFPGVLIGSVAHIARYITLAAGRLAAMATAGSTGFAGESSDARVARLASYAGITSVLSEAGVSTSTPFVDITGTSPLAAINDVAKAEGGAVFIGGGGTLAMQNRQHRSLQTAPVLTMTNDEIDPDSQVAGDMQLVQNLVTTSAGSTGAVQTAQNAASRTTHGDYPVDLTGLLVATDELALNAAQWRVAKYAEPFRRMPDLGFDLATLTPAQQANVMAVEISDRVRITGMPAQAITTTLDLLVEGWTETLGADSWTWEANTSNFATEAAWVLDSATYSVLDSTTQLSY